MGARTPATLAPRRLRRALAALAACALTAPVGGSAGGAETETETKVQVAYVYHFARFVDWRGDLAAGTSEPIRICSVGSGPIVATLGGLAGRDVRGRPVQVAQVEDPTAQPPCHLLFVARSEAARLDALFERLEGLPVLTVSDIPGFARRGGMIGFVTEERRVRIEANPRNARRAGLRISAKVLEIARVVP